MSFAHLPEDRARRAQRPFDPPAAAHDLRAVPDAPRPGGRARYVAGPEGREAAAEPSRPRDGRVGIGGARRRVAVCNGGPGPGGLPRRHLGRRDAAAPGPCRAGAPPGGFAEAYDPATPQRPARRMRRGRTG